MNKRRKRKRYTDEFKAEVLRAVETRGQRTIGEVAASLGVSESLIHVWKNKLGEEAAQGDRGETPEQEVRRLRRENADLKKDRDVLAESIAVFVKEGPSPQRAPSSYDLADPRLERKAAACRAGA